MNNHIEPVTRIKDKNGNIEKIVAGDGNVYKYDIDHLGMLDEMPLHTISNDSEKVSENNKETEDNSEKSGYSSSSSTSSISPNMGELILTLGFLSIGAFFIYAGLQSPGSGALAITLGAGWDIGIGLYAYSSYKEREMKLKEEIIGEEVSKEPLKELDAEKIKEESVIENKEFYSRMHEVEQDQEEDDMEF